MQTNPDYEMHLRPEEDYEMHFEDAGLKPEQTATVTPDYETQTVRPDPGCVFSEVTVEAIPEPTEEIDITENGTVDVARYGTANVAVPVGVFPEGTENISQNGDYDVTLKETAHVEVVPDLQDKTVTPTEQTQTIEADAGYGGLDTVTVNPIPPEYVVPSGSVEITQNGTVPVSGKATANVNVPQGVFPSGTKVITQNVTGEDVTNYTSVDVAVPGPTGTKQISITQNGTTTEDVTNYADAEIVADIPVGATDSEFFKIKKTTITVGENSVINRNTFLQLMIGMLEPNSMIIAFSMAERKSAYQQNEILLGQYFYHDQTLSAGFGTSYFGAWRERDDHIRAQIQNWVSDNAAAIIVPGTKYDVYYRDIVSTIITDRFPEV